MTDLSFTFGNLGYNCTGIHWDHIVTHWRVGLKAITPACRTSDVTRGDSPLESDAQNVKLRVETGGS